MLAGVTQSCVTGLVSFYQSLGGVESWTGALAGAPASAPARL
jgi:hypothetical protein